MNQSRSVNESQSSPDTATQTEAESAGRAAENFSRPGEQMSLRDTGPGAAKLSEGAPSRPLLGRLPLARLIPQDVHSVLDYVDAATVFSGAILSDCPKARTASALIGGSGMGLSALTDYRLSLAKVIPIEAHEVVDYAFGVSAIGAPFLFGYYKTAPITAAIHVATGVGTILASLFTDYRAYRGVGRRSTV